MGSTERPQKEPQTKHAWKTLKPNKTNGKSTFYILLAVPPGASQGHLELSRGLPCTLHPPMRRPGASQGHLEPSWGLPYSLLMACQSNIAREMRHQAPGTRDATELITSFKTLFAIHATFKLVLFVHDAHASGLWPLVWLRRDARSVYNYNFESISSKTLMKTQIQLKFYIGLKYNVNMEGNLF